MRIRTYRRLAIALLAATLVTAAALRSGSAQEKFPKGQTIAPSYEGFIENRDGTFDLVFGYLNRNYDELLDVPIGPENNIEPGGPDRGQPTHFLTRRRRHQFSIKVPKDFGNKEVVWTLTSQGKTEKAYGTLKPDYILDNRVMMMNNSSFGQRGNEGDNVPPVVKLEGAAQRTVKVGEPATFAAIVTDDGLPAPPEEADRRPAGGGDNARKREYGLRASWYVYRRAGSVTFDSEQLVRPYPAGRTPPPLAKDGRTSVKATFGAPGTYVLRVIGDDMGLHTTQDVTVTVVP
jgi:hypothetical protein